MNGGAVIPVGDELPAMDRTATARRDPPKRIAGKSKTPTAKRPAGAVKRRFGLLNATIDRAMPSMTRAELAVWLLLFRHAKPDGIVSASVADLVRRTGSGERSVRYALERMRDGGLLDRVKRGTLAGGPSVYRLRHPP